MEWFKTKALRGEELARIYSRYLAGMDNFYTLCKNFTYDNSSYPGAGDDY